MLEILYTYGMTAENTGEVLLEKHDPRLLNYWRDMAKINMPRAQLELGKIRLYGIGVPADKERGLKLLKASGMAEAKMVIADHYYQEDDREAAEKWWRKAAEEDNIAEAWHNLGVNQNNRN